MENILYENVSNSITKKFYSVKELSDLLGVSKALIYEKVEKGLLPAKRLGRRILIPQDYVKKNFLS